MQGEGSQDVKANAHQKNTPWHKLTKDDENTLKMQKLEK